MGVLFGSRRSFRPTPAELPEALQELLGEVKQEKAELEVILERLRQSTTSVGRMDKELTELSSRQAGMSEALAETEERARRVEELTQQIGRA